MQGGVRPPENSAEAARIRILSRKRAQSSDPCECLFGHLYKVNMVLQQWWKLDGPWYSNVATSVCAELANPPKTSERTRMQEVLEIQMRFR